MLRQSQVLHRGRPGGAAFWWTCERISGKRALACATHPANDIPARTRRHSRRRCRRTSTYRGGEVMRLRSALVRAEATPITRAMGFRIVASVVPLVVALSGPSAPAHAQPVGNAVTEWN